MDRAEHLRWCKDRALEFIKKNDLAGAWTSMVSDLCSHPETKGHAAIFLGNNLFFAGFLNTEDKMEKFIEDFH